MGCLRRTWRRSNLRIGNYCLGLVRVATLPSRSVNRPAEDDALTARVGRESLRALGTAGDALDFLGEAFLA